MAEPNLLFAFNLPPEAAIRYFDTLGYEPPENWRDIAADVQARAKTIAGIYRQDIVADMYASMRQSVAAGTPFDTWRKAVLADWAAKGLAHNGGDIVDTATGEVLGVGINKNRLATIYRTNVGNAHMAGLWQSLQANKDNRPYLQYNAVNDHRTRPSHAALDNLVYHIDDPFWDYYMPLNGYRCRCSVIALSERDVARANLTVAQSRPEQFERVEYTNRKNEPAGTVTAFRLPDGRTFAPDLGFDRNTARNHLAALGQMQLERAADLPPRLAAMAVGESLQSPVLRRALSDELMTAYRAIAFKDGTPTRPTNRPIFVGGLSMELLDRMAAKNIRLPESGVIASSDTLMRHALRDVKAARGQTLPQEFWADIADKLRTPEAVYYDPAGALLYFYADPERAGNLFKVVVTLDYDGFKRSKHPKTGVRENLVLNVVDTGTLIEKSGMDLKMYIPIIDFKEKSSR